jgi:hypothetical protein
MAELTAAELNEGLRTLAELNQARAEIRERQIRLLREIQAHGIENAPADLFDLLDACSDKIDEINQQVALGEYMIGVARSAEQPAKLN